MEGPVLGRLEKGAPDGGIKHICVCLYICIYSLPQLMNFKLFGKTMPVVNIQFELFFGPSTQQLRIYIYIYIYGG